MIFHVSGSFVSHIKACFLMDRGIGRAFTGKSKELKL